MNNKFKIYLYSASLNNDSCIVNLPQKILKKTNEKDLGNFIELIASLADIKKIQKCMIKHYHDPIPWYLDGYQIGNNNKRICAFGADDGQGGKSFILDKNDLKKYYEVIDYGLKAGIPIQEMDFLNLKDKYIANIIKQIKYELKNCPYKTVTDHQYFYKPKEKIKSYNLKTPVVREISKKYWQQVKHLPKQEIFKLCEQLLKTGYNEDSTIAFDWAFRLKKQYQPEDFKIFESWVKKYCNNWSKVDDFCTHAFGELILQYPQFLAKLKTWAKSKNMWVRRSAAVIFIYPNRYKNHLKQILEIADILLLDKEDLVQKGYGWLLKEASRKYQKQVFQYVMKNKAVMPRTALRYAIELMPLHLKKQAMSK